MASLDVLDYNPVDHLNALFGHPSTLSSVPTVSKSLTAFQHELDGEINQLVAQQAASDSDSVQRIQAAKNDLDDLFRKIESVQTRASETERTITDMTAEIKRLDNTKRNLTLSMTALKRLQMLTTAYEQLQSLSGSRQYRDCSQLVQAVIQLMAHFKTYRSIDQIAALSRNVSETQRELLEQVCEDFEVTFARGETDQKRVVLSEGCLVMDALGDQARSRLVTWYCNTQLREYRSLFRSSDEAGSLDNISRRYSWFKRLLKTYDDHHAGIFPMHWRVDESLANSFCETTRDDFRTILSKAVKRTEGQSLSPELLLSCLQETLDFEQGLELRFAKPSRVSIDTDASADETRQPYIKAMSEAFEPYLSIWIDAQDKKLAIMLSKYRAQGPLSGEEQFSSQMVITTSTELFGFYRSLLNQCVKLSTGQQLLELSKLFGRYLERYAQSVLLQYISERLSGQNPSQAPSVEDIVLVLHTADYCYNTSTQLEERIKSRVDEKFKEQVDLETQADEFMGIANAAVRALVRKIELSLEPGWRNMRNLNWSKTESVHEQSEYVSEVSEQLNRQVKAVLEIVSKQQYARAFCDNLIELLTNSFANNIIASKPISEIGAEQLLLDLYALTKTAEQLVVLNSPSGTQPPAAFVKRTNQSFSRIGPLLKTIQVRPSPAESLVSAYLIHVADKSDTNFRRILEIKGVRKQDQAQLMELFIAHKAGNRYDELPAQNTLLTPLLTSGGASVSSSLNLGGNIGGAGLVGIGSISGLPALGAPARPGLPNIFEGGSSLGNAFLSAAKDSVDKLGTPSLSASGSRTVSPQPPGNTSGLGAQTLGDTTGNVNQNLRNLGKFFKRDLGNFGGRFSGARGDEGGK